MTLPDTLTDAERAMCDQWLALSAEEAAFRSKLRATGYRLPGRAPDSWLEPRRRMHAISRQLHEQHGIDTALLCSDIEPWCPCADCPPRPA